MKMSRVLKMIVIVFVVVLVIILVLPVVFSGALVGTPLPPFQLPELSATAAGTDALSLDGTWTAGDGSAAGFRVGESFLLQSGTLVGRTSAVTGSLVISDDQVASGSFQVDLSQVTITIGEKTNNLSSILDTDTHPYATFTLTSPIDTANLPADGATMTSTATGTLTLNEITRPITISLTGRYDGSLLEATGSASILVSDWGMKSPIAIHNDAEIEFLIVLQRE